MDIYQLKMDIYQLKEIERTDTGAARADELLDEIHRLRRGLIECAQISGEEVESPYHLGFPDIVVFATRAVRDLRSNYDAMLEDIPF